MGALRAAPEKLRKAASLPTPKKSTGSKQKSIPKATSSTGNSKARVTKAKPSPTPKRKTSQPQVTFRQSGTKQRGFLSKKEAARRRVEAQKARFRERAKRKKK